MKIVRIINNNIVTSENDENNEIVIMGKGVGFQKKPGDEIKPHEIEKIYSLDTPSSTNNFTSLLEDVPLEEVQVINEIVSYAKLSFGKKIGDSIYVSLLDHLHFAIERLNKGMIFENRLSWEVKHFYHHEYLVGKEALDIIKRKLNIELPEPEAISIALHFVNCTMDTNMEDTIGMTKVIKKILSLIQYSFNIQLKEQTLNYERFLTHIKFFLQRVYLRRSLEDKNPELFEFIKRSWPKEFDCASKIVDYVKQETGSIISNAEIAYLTIHINRIIND